MTQKWVSVSDACAILNISKSTLYRRINQGEIESRREGKLTMCLIDVSDESQKGTDETNSETYQIVDQLRSENEYLRQQVTQLAEKLNQKDEDLRRKDEQAEQAKERSDTIILQLTRQLENQQKLLEYHQSPWWQRWFRRSRTMEGK